MEQLQLALREILLSLYSPTFRLILFIIFCSLTMINIISIHRSLTDKLAGKFKSENILTVIKLFMIAINIIIAVLLCCH